MHRLTIVLLAVAAQPLSAQTAPPLAGPSATAPASAARISAPTKTALAKTALAKTGSTTAATPNAERVITVAAIDKRTGLTRSYVGKPGESFTFGALTVRVRACEATPPWEQPLEGAFLLIDEQIGQLAPRRVYSGWMFAQSPSLHPLEHARYDVWVKSCAMRFPETGPDTVVAAKSVVSGAATDPARSKAKKSAETASAPSN